MKNKLTRGITAVVIAGTATLGLTVPAEAASTVVRVYAQTVGRASLDCKYIYNGVLVKSNGPLYDEFGRKYWLCHKR